MRKSLKIAILTDEEDGCDDDGDCIFHFEICVGQLMHSREHGRMEMMIVGMVMIIVVMKMVVMIGVIAYFQTFNEVSIN